MLNRILKFCLGAEIFKLEVYSELNYGGWGEINRSGGFGIFPRTKKCLSTLLLVLFFVYKNIALKGKFKLLFLLCYKDALEDLCDAEKWLDQLESLPSDHDQNFLQSITSVHPEQQLHHFVEDSSQSLQPNQYFDKNVQEAENFFAGQSQFALAKHHHSFIYHRSTSGPAGYPGNGHLHSEVILEPRSNSVPSDMYLMASNFCDTQFSFTQSQNMSSNS